MNPLIDCPWRLVVSDLDGTLVTGTTALNHLGAWIGHEAIVEGLEDKFTRREVSDREIAEGYAPFYGGVALADAVEAAAPTALTFHCRLGPGASAPGQTVATFLGTGGPAGGGWS